MNQIRASIVIWLTKPESEWSILPVFVCVCVMPASSTQFPEEQEGRATWCCSLIIHFRHPLTPAWLCSDYSSQPGLKVSANDRTTANNSPDWPSHRLWVEERLALAVLFSQKMTTLPSFSIMCTSVQLNSMLNESKVLRLCLHLVLWGVHVPLKIQYFPLVNCQCVAFKRFCCCGVKRWRSRPFRPI